MSETQAAILIGVTAFLAVSLFRIGMILQNILNEMRKPEHQNPHGGGTK